MSKIVSSNKSQNIQLSPIKNSNVNLPLAGNSEFINCIALTLKSSFLNYKELSSYMSISLDGYSSYFSELIHNRNFSKAQEAFIKTTSERYEQVRQGALKSNLGSILGDDSSLAKQTNVSSFLTAFGLAPELISQPVVMLINCTAIEATRRIIAPKMGFYEFAEAEDKSETLRVIKSARQIAILALLSARPGGFMSLGVSGSISVLVF